MEVYSFHPAVRTSFQHRVMAALDAWFFLGGHRLKVVSLDSCNSGWAYQELVSISTTEKVLKLLSYLLVPIVIIALLIRCLLHSNFRIDVEKERWLKIRELGIDIESCKLPSSYVNQVSSFIWFEKDKSKRPRIDVDYHTLHSKDWVVFPIVFQKIPKTSRFSYWFSQKETRKRDYVRNMLDHVIGYLTSEGGEWLQYISKTSYQSATSLDPERVLQYCLTDNQELQGEVQRLLNEESATKSSGDKEVLLSHVSDIICQCWWPKFLEVIQSPAFIEELVEEVSGKLNLDFLCLEKANTLDQELRNSLLRAVVHHGSEGVDIKKVGAGLIIYTEAIQLQIPFSRS
ncbi:hypothetical protein CpB1015 [Chlamydia pneumoniae TW-183]|uniref:Uncharacterized protein n=3 Tax=Chlamydia pneumoniae TaxID=83558 RepID=Q9Z6T1_CHLPN|nr:DUF648 domain-containing protein [Chlamydia pneumoniae]AAD19115.1 hypothetical protein CPn_0978 [Chlamydia pneumoniae CWL029]AAF38666.1 hypothetical protein CP_0878 [Chlamydia pneumoniae AR39]AAP98944.1 hypothetical protein CpB1015 [Chlamydia pneumoniae TW-183]CRI33518.1 Uncharacterized protein BN1224_Wien1_A_10250 [Chlamydia pneumoniae]CRI39770.1 Uncharacterized protein BN1224_CWL011_A_10340 [Chlamydia pneumoniae]